MNRTLSYAALFLIFLFAGCVPASPPQPEQPLQILFIGNSYTFVNQMPEMFANLAESGGHRVEVTSLAKSGYSLTDHTQDPETNAVLQGQRWDYVILQEKSDLPVLSGEKEGKMYLGVRQLNQLAVEQSAETVLFMPWAYRDGFPSAGLIDYPAMQSSVANAYMAIAREFDLSVAPVGIVWQAALILDPQLALWNMDGSHPSPLGSYLAANVFYALIIEQSPVGLPHPDSDEVKTEIAKFVQEIAAEIVLENPENWNIP